MSHRKPYPNLSPRQQNRRLQQAVREDLNEIALQIAFNNSSIPTDNTNNEAIAPSNDVDDGNSSGVESRELNRDAIENGSVDVQSDNEHGVIPPPFDGLGDSSNDSDQNEQSVSDNSETDSANTDPDGSSRDGDFSESSDSDDQDEFDSKSFLREWSLTNSITLCATSKLFVGLREAGHGELPNDARTLLQTPSTSTLVKAIGSGSYAHYGLRKAILDQCSCIPQRLIPRVLLLTVHVDGVKISKSSSSELITILGVISNCELFTEFHNWRPSWCRVVLEKISADTPAKNFLLNFPPHNSRCGKCIQDGINIGRRRFFLENNAPLRKAHNSRAGVPEKYIDLSSPLEDFVDPINQISIDPMHHYYLGVAKKHIKLFVSFLESVGSDELMQQLDDDYKAFKKWTPMEFGRKPRKFVEFPYFKATEFRLLLLYTAPVIFSKYINDEKMLHFNLLDLATRYLSCEEYCSSKNADARELLGVYVDGMKNLYGEHNLIYNVHNLLHSPDDVLLHGTLDSYAAWKFENHFRFLRKNVRQGNQVLAQIINRSNEQAVVTMSRSRAKNKEVFLHPPDFKISRPLKNVDLPEGYEDPQREIEFLHFTLTTSVPNNCCYLDDGSLISIQFICKKSSTGRQVILFKEFTDCSTIENYPIDSREIGIYLVIMGKRGGPLATSTQLSPMAQKLLNSQTVLSQPSEGLTQETPPESHVFPTKAKRRKLNTKPPKVQTVPKASSTFKTAVLAQFKKPRCTGKQVIVQKKEIAQKSLTKEKDVTVQATASNQEKPSSSSTGIFLAQDQLRALQRRCNSGKFDPKDFFDFPQDSGTSTQSKRTLDSGEDSSDEDLDEDAETPALFDNSFTRKSPQLFGSDSDPEDDNDDYENQLGDPQNNPDQNVEPIDQDHDDFSNLDRTSPAKASSYDDQPNQGNDFDSLDEDFKMDQAEAESNNDQSDEKSNPTLPEAPCRLMLIKILEKLTELLLRYPARAPIPQRKEKPKATDFTRLPSLPCKTHEELLKFSTDLTTNEPLKNEYMSYLALFGGLNHVAAIITMLLETISNELANVCTWKIVKKDKNGKPKLMVGKPVLYVFEVISGLAIDLWDGYHDAKDPRTKISVNHVGNFSIIKA
ncbi:hypothetical protein QAD02_007814 [Eretmocerus hayati]|uniref:Uncharacterized protein n=1 Tax=Eretmocerus hayati TaxID=131215 RepID=A0ACC2N4Q9_9HYME|nr:hypothetical protein QAD02_007814 [Eretmocerus hayati]